MSQVRTPPAGEHPQRIAVLVLAWLWVAAPFTYGVWQLLAKVTQLFGG